MAASDGCPAPPRNRKDEDLAVGSLVEPITFPAGSRNRGVISDASGPLGCTMSPPWAVTVSIVAAAVHHDLVEQAR